MALSKEILEFIEDELWQDIQFFYQDEGFEKDKRENYMLSEERLGSKKHPVYKKCLSYIAEETNKGDWYSYYISCDTWEELLEVAKMRDGKPLRDVIIDIYRLNEQK